MKKFDLDNLPDLKIRVSNAAESERAQRAFFALGGKWNNGQELTHLTRKYLMLEKCRKLWHCDSVEFFKQDPSQEITLEDLEALAAEKQGLNSFETMIFQEVPTSGKAAIEAMEKAIGSEDDASWGEFEPGELERAEMEAQARYDAAMRYLNSASVFDIENMNKMHFKALKIAAGIKID